MRGNIDCSPFLCVPQACGDDSTASFHGATVLVRKSNDKQEVHTFLMYTTGSYHLASMAAGWQLPGSNQCKQLRALSTAQ